MTSTQIRQSFLDFFKSKQHTIVRSSPLDYRSRDGARIFTNAGMNQFVPIFLGEQKADVDKWGDALAKGLHTRAADTQKCIRATGKHNDLDDVGLDTYHHTFFEMLGNWSFGDYFKKEAIEWAWELVVGIWKFPAQRLYATVFCPDPNQWENTIDHAVLAARNRLAGVPVDLQEPPEGAALTWPDMDASVFWAEYFLKAGLDPKTHIVPGNRKDNFWMMGDTGPCGPCSELHVDLTPVGDTRGSLVNQGDARCIEIWNLVFIQFNANPDGTFTPLPARHVDTGMGFERVTSIIQGTKGFTDFANARISNYETDIFRPIFDELERLSGKKYTSTLPSGTPAPGGAHAPSRVADGALAVSSGDDTRPRVSQLAPSPIASEAPGTTEPKYSRRNLPHFERPWAKYMVTFSTRERRQLTPPERDLALKSVLYAQEHRQVQLYAACVMPDHVHLLFEPQIKEQDKGGQPVFWSLSEILQGIKSASAHNINRASGQKGHVWEQDSVDRMIRGQSDMEEKFHYICRNPWDAGIVPQTENYPWLWLPSGEHTRPRVSQSAPSPIASSGDLISEVTPSDSARPALTARAQSATREGACAPREAAAPLPQDQQIAIDIAFRVIADHIRTLSFAIADGIQPGNTDRNYVLRRILRRAVRYGRTLGFHEPFFYKLVDVLTDTMGEVFPEIRAKKKQVQEVIQREEEAFNKTLDGGLQIFDQLVTLHERFSRLSDVVKPAADRLAKALTSADAKKTPFNTFGADVIAIVNAVNACGIQLWQKIASQPEGLLIAQSQKLADRLEAWYRYEDLSERDVAKLELLDSVFMIQNTTHFLDKPANVFWGSSAFLLYDTYGFPLDLTELMARERGLSVDTAGFEKLMEEQRARARAAQKKEVISISQVETTTPTQFIGFDKLETPAKVLEVVSLKEKIAVILDTSACYAEMGGQVGDTGELSGSGHLWRITNTHKSGNTWLHFIEEGGPHAPSRVAVGSGEHTRPRVSQSAPSPIASGTHPSSETIPSDSARPALTARAQSATREGACAPPEAAALLPVPGSAVLLSVDRLRRHAIERHHTVTHLLHWALHEVASRDASQKGSFVGPDKLTFDFNSAPLTPAQVADIEKLVNERILENAPVSWTEVPYADVRGRKDVMQFFGDKYGDTVRVVQIGGQPAALDGYSMELCGGTHTRATGEIGLFRITGENAIAAGVRRIEAVAGLEAYGLASDQLRLLRAVAGHLNSPVAELEKKVESLLAQQKELEKQVKQAMQRNASNAASELLGRAEAVNGIPLIAHNLGDADGEFLQAIADSLKGRFKGVVVLGGLANDAVTLIASVSPDFTAKVQAGKIIQAIAPIVGGKGGGRPDNARGGGGKDASKLNEALAKARTLLG